MNHSCSAPFVAYKDGTPPRAGRRPERRRREEPQWRRAGWFFTGSGLGYTSAAPMLWFSIWFLVILKIPIAYLGYVIWWAVKDPPMPSTGPGNGRIESGDDGGGTGGPGLTRRPRKPIPGRRPGPHGVPARRPQPSPLRERIARGA